MKLGPNSHLCALLQICKAPFPALTLLGAVNVCSAFAAPFGSFLKEKDPLKSHLCVPHCFLNGTWCLRSESEADRHPTGAANCPCLHSLSCLTSDQEPTAVAALD